MTIPLQIRSKSHVYPVHLGPRLLGQTGSLLRAQPFARSGTKCAVITDETVFSLYGTRLEASLLEAGYLPVMFTCPVGEGSKSLTELGRLAQRLAEAQLDRTAFIVALGGGVVGDLAGFLAAIYHRGVPFVQIPTTIVSQVDSAIGGKTGVNLPAGKNLLGSFHPPSLVIADVQTLDTLPAREFNEGIAEAIKHAVIRDPDLLESLANLDRRDVTALEAVIRRNLEIKADIVACDEFERGGERALLNFGHTVGHAVEQAAGYGRLLHGEAISLGMVAAARLSMRKAGLSEAQYASLIHALERFNLPTVLPEDCSTETILESMARDKKFECGGIRFVLTSALGSAFVSAPGQVTWEDLRRETQALRHAESPFASGGGLAAPGFT